MNSSPRLTRFSSPSSFFPSPTFNATVNPLQEAIHLTRRDFTTTANGIGAVALASLLQQKTFMQPPLALPGQSLSHRENLISHLAPKTTIFIFMEGAPSQLDLFDPKPKLNELNGQPLPESLTKNMRFAFKRNPQS
jgi:hypothetical protein